MIGGAAGYWFGAKAGRERYLQLQRWVRQAQDNDKVATVTEKAKAAVDTGKERLVDLRKGSTETAVTVPPATDVEFTGADLAPDGAGILP